MTTIYTEDPSYKIHQRRMELLAQRVFGNYLILEKIAECFDLEKGKTGHINDIEDGERECLDLLNLACLNRITVRTFKSTLKLRRMIHFCCNVIAKKDLLEAAIMTNSIQLVRTFSQNSKVRRQDGAVRLFLAAKMNNFAIFTHMINLKGQYYGTRTIYELIDKYFIEGDFNTIRFIDTYG